MVQGMFQTGSGSAPTGSKTGSAQKLHILSPMTPELTFMNVFRPEVLISQPEVGLKVLKNAYFGPSDLRNPVQEGFQTGSELLSLTDVARALPEPSDLRNPVQEDFWTGS